MAASSKNNNITMHQNTNLGLDHHHQQVLHHDHNDQQPTMSFGMMLQPNTSSAPTLNPSLSFMGKEGGGYDQFGTEFDQALFMYLDSHDPSSSALQDQRQNSGMRPPTLNIFPSQPMHVEPSSSKAIRTMGLVSPASSGSKRSFDQASVDLSKNESDNVLGPATATTAAHAVANGALQHKNQKREVNDHRVVTSSNSEQEGGKTKTPDSKTLRRLAQNREAARKSRLRKKAYVQQLESSRMKLTQLEQEIHRARVQGTNVINAGGVLLGIEPQGVQFGNNISSEAAMFEMEYARWVEEHLRLMSELRSAMHDRIPDNELRMFVDNCLGHFTQMINLKGMLAKTDVFHLVSGTWKTPAERCFMWMGGFRPSNLLKVVHNQIEPLSDTQLVGVYALEQSTHDAEEALSQGLDALHQSLSEVIVSEALTGNPHVNNYMGQMAMAMAKLNTLEGFVKQADTLRLQTIHRLHQLLTVRQAARCLLAIAEYFHRLRALSSLWMARPRQDYEKN